MRPLLRNTFQLSVGTRARVMAYFLVCASCGAVGFLAVLHLDQMALFEPMTLYQRWIVAASAIGGVFALKLAGDRVGAIGKGAVVRGISGGLWVTFVGALIGGTLALPFYGTMFGPFIVGVTLLGQPVLVVFWVMNLVAVHYLMKTYQRERDTIFVPRSTYSNI